MKARANKILAILKRVFTLPDWRSETRDPFEALIVTVISQNTHRRNTTRAFENLSNRFPITPAALSKAPFAEIATALKVAGLPHSKARAINNLATIVHEQ
jgi:endonuclease III